MIVYKENFIKQTKECLFNKGGDPHDKIYKLLSFIQNPRDVADPWYTGDFNATYRDVVAGCKGFLAFLRETELIH